MPQESPQRKHIRHIRQNKFLLADDGTSLGKNQLELDLRNALHRLSQDLYSNVHHFILELIQNAEDNDYANDDAKLIFELRSDDPTETPNSGGCLCILNNETGFTCRNVASICAVGQSTKSSQQGYIGEKGIGFKSVFVVSPRPHIFSKGYQFYFRKPDDEDPLGYIVPHWKEHIPDCVANSNATTSLLLPLEANWREDIAKKLRVIEPESILFLKKLKGIHVAIPAEDFTRTMLKDEDESRRFVTLVAGGAEHPYFVCRKSFKRSTDLIETNRAGITEREVTVALPLGENVQCDGRVFAFLPTECRSGLPFLVNADFLLSANRESIHFNYIWNCWLRNCVAPTFVEAFTDLLKNETHRSDSYKFIPLAEELQTQAREFFQPIVEGIHKALKETPCVLTSRDGQLVLPASAHLIGKTERELVELEDLPPLLQTLSLVAPGLERWRERLKPLGVQTFSAETLLRAINDKAWLERRSVEWFTKLFSRLQATSVATAALAHIPFVRCADGVCRTPSQGPVYFRSGEGTANVTLPTPGPAIHFLDSGVAAMLSGNTTLSQWAQAAIGVREFSLREYIVSSLLPWLVGQTENRSALIVGTQFIVANLSVLDEAGLQAVRDKLPWLLDDGRILTRTAIESLELVTPRCFEPADGWPWVFVGELDCRHFLVVADDYCANVTDVQRPSWDKLFKACNVTSTPDPQVFKLEQANQRYQEVFERCSREVPGLPALSECYSPRWLRQLEQPESVETKIKALVRLLNALVAFDRPRFDNFLRVRKWHIGQWRNLNCASEFSIALKSQPWLPTTQGYRKPAEAFWPSDEIKEFLQDRVPYVSGQLKKECAEILGVHTSLTAPMLIGFLRELRIADQVDFEVVWRIYRRLAGTPGFDASFFQNEPLIFVPTQNRAWLKRDEVVWRNRKSVFGGMFGYLENDYDNLDLHGFFTSALGVAEEPGIKDFAQAWARLLEPPEPIAETVIKSLTIILPKLLNAHDELANAEWWPMLRGNLKLWTNGAKFLPRAETYLADDGIAAELFRDTVSFAWWPETSSSHRATDFLRELGAKSLAEAVQIKIRYSDEQRIAATPQILTDAAKELLSLLVCDMAGTEWTSRRSLLEAVVCTEEFLVSKIEADYSLRNDNAAGVAPQKQDAHWNLEHRRLLVCEGAELEEMRSFAAASIARALFGAAQSKQMADTIFRFLTVGHDTAKRIRREKNWQLRPEQAAWLESVMPDNTISRETPKPEPAEPPAQTSPASSREAAQPARSNATTEEKIPTTSTSTSAPTQTERVTTPESQTGATDNPPNETADTQPTQSTDRPRDKNRTRRTRRVVTYVQSEESEPPGDENSEARSAKDAERKRIGEAAEKFVVEWEKSKGREAFRLGGNNEGYDIESFDPKAGRKRFIEVKGIDGSWEDDASVGMTAPQFDSCRKLGDNYWLYVVEHAMSETPPSPHCFKNPVASVTSYRFDKNWRQLLAPEE